MEGRKEVEKLADFTLKRPLLPNIGKLWFSFMHDETQKRHTQTALLDYARLRV